MSRNIRFTNCIALLLMLVVACNQSATAQLSAIHNFARIDSVLLISENEDTLRYPFAGALNNCQFMNMDINLDGTEDLLVFDRHGNRILPFIVSSSSSLKLMPELASLFPPVEHWMQAVDYNYDGKKDIFTYTVGGIKVYRNDSESTLRFTQVTDPYLLSLQGNTLTNILVTYADYPAITDIDKDGDKDVLTFWGLGTFIEWHENTSMEQFGNANSLTFKKSSSCWGQFAEGIEDNIIILDTCAGSGKLYQGSENVSDDPKHTGSTLLINDLNGDGLPDLALGDVDFNTLFQLTNGGTLADAKITSNSTDFPNAVNPVSLSSFPAAMLADVDNDGQQDLLVSPFEPSLTKSANFKSVSLYHNAGTNALPDFNRVSESYLQDQMLDLGSGAYPVFFDYNNDGLMDLLVGNYGYTDTCIYTPLNGLQCTFTAKIALLLNEGSLTKPQFRLIDRNIAQLDALQLQSLIPSVADMDGDGDADMVCGNSKGKLVYCENIALAGQPAEFKLVDPAWLGNDIGDFSAPQLFDMDMDGLTDLICGKRNGMLNYYKNTGSLQEPQFTLMSEKFGGVDVTDTLLSNYGYIVPCFYKDKQGDIKLFSGSEYGDIFVYDKISNNLEGDFHLLGTIPGINEGWRSGVAIGNLNNDTLTDMLVGNYSGGLGLFYGKPENTFGVKDRNPASPVKLLINPNPAANQVSVSLSSDMFTRPESIVIQSLDGKIVRRYSQVEFPLLMDVSDLANGIFLISVRSNLGITTGKLVICR